VSFSDFGLLLTTEDVAVTSVMKPVGARIGVIEIIR
jgi:hypothetical protein